MKNEIIKKFLAIREKSANGLKNKKEAIRARSEKLDPNNKETQQKPFLKGDTERKIRNDGFEHRSSEETTDRV